MKDIGAVLITGSAQRIGRELALELAAKGYDIVISYNNSLKEAEELAQKIRKDFAVRCEVFRCDLRDEKQTQQLAQFVKKEFKNWNLLVNNASIFRKSKFLSGLDSELLENLNIHLISPLILAKEFAEHVTENGIEKAQIINMIDKNITRYDTQYFHYLFSKKSLAEATKMLALELAPQVRVNGIAPGFILNSIDAENSYLETENLLKKIPLKSQGNAQQIWQAVEFLLNNEFVTGQILFVDGGASLNHAG